MSFASDPEALFHEGYVAGKEAAEATATWATDGNSDVEERRRVLQMLRDGDPQAYDYLPREPNLSGEWADDPTPRSLIQTLGYDYDSMMASDDAPMVDGLCDAYEEGVSDHFEAACERELMQFVGEEVTQS